MRRTTILLCEGDGAGTTLRLPPSTSSRRSLWGGSKSVSTVYGGRHGKRISGSSISTGAATALTSSSPSMTLEDAPGPTLTTAHSKLVDNLSAAGGGGQPGASDQAAE